MLTLREILDDAAALPEFANVAAVGVNTRGSNGWTPLHWMAYLGDVRGVELLLSAGAEIDAVDEEGNTPLHAAIGSRQHLVVGVLVQRGADATLRNATGQTPRDLAAVERYPPSLEAFRDAG